MVDRLPVDEVAPESGLLYVARLDGRRMGDRDGVFARFQEELRLPDYFGWNWDALIDCLRDLRWLGAERCLLVVEHAEALLADHPGERAELLETLERLSAGSAGGAGRGRVPLRVVLLAD
ncbi:barstar family protein [Streptomyces profundus]|uniref:barstar family protein n=1 Tax=Streptomyces profundus TaxID=2867410 RepID=UPI001D1635B5|nr:barstar family protein [Streptomyces sp. MA3_2.13]UED87269.1 barstar family protein [Streptomyces sp. MA3_2.13]